MPDETKDKKKVNQVIVRQKCSATFTFNDGNFITDHDAVLVEVSTQGALVTSKHDIDIRALKHLETAVNGGQGQIIPFAGKIKRSEKCLHSNGTCYFMKFQGSNSQAQRYINIHAPKSTGRKRKIIPDHKSDGQKGGSNE